MILTLAYIAIVGSTRPGLSALVNPISVQVDGDGYLRFSRDAHLYYATKAVIGVCDGFLATADGFTISPRVAVPADARHIDIDLQGTVSYSSGASHIHVGNLVLALFPNKTEMAQIGGFGSTTTKPVLYTPGDGLAGVLRTAVSKVQLMASRPVPHTGSRLRPEVVFSPRSEVDKPTILLGDVAEIFGSEADKAKLALVDLGPAPIHGSARSFSRVHVMTRIRMVGYAADAVDLTVPFGAEVVTKSQPFTHEQVEQAAMAELQRVFGDGCGFSVSSPVRSGTVGTGTMSFACTAGKSFDDRVSVLVRVLVDGNQIDSRTVSFDSTIASVQVKPADHVRVRILKSGVTVEVAGRLRQTGRVGSNVNVVTEDGAELTGMLKSASLVEVKL